VDQWPAHTWDGVDTQPVKLKPIHSQSPVELAMLRHKLVAIYLLVVLTSSSVPSLQAGDLVSAPDSLIQPVKHQLTIDLRLLGFSNSSIRADALTQYLPTSINPILQDTSLSHGVSFEIAYSLLYCSESIERDLRTYIQSRMIVKGAPAYLQQFFSDIDPALYATISVGDLQNWLLSKGSDIGVADSRYTILLANVTGISEHDHFYEAIYQERDASFQASTYHNLTYFFPVIDWTIAWSVGRLYFLDLSAGSRLASRDYTLRKNPHVPIQHFLSEYRFLNNRTIGEYAADHVSEVIRNVLISDYSRLPSLSTDYDVRIFFVDDTHRIYESSYARFLDVDRVRESLRELVPYAQFHVEVNFVQLDASAEVGRYVENSLIHETRRIGFGQRGLVVGLYDARQIYSRLRSSSYTYSDQTNSQIVVFVLALRSGSRLIDTYQGRVGQQGLLDPDGEPRDSPVYVFQELALVSSNERHLLDWGRGVTRSVIQATGSMLGLPNSPARESCAVQPSVMSSCGYSLEFTQFDKDLIHRAHADYLLAIDKEQLVEIGGLTLLGVRDPVARSLFENATQSVELGLHDYDGLRFESAIGKLEQAQAVLDRLFEERTRFLQATLEGLGNGETPIGAALAVAARAKLAQATEARARGAFPTSFRLLTEAGFQVAAAKSVEETYSSSRVNNFIIGLLVGFAIAAGITILGLSRRTRMEVCKRTLACRSDTSLTNPL